MKRLAMSAVLLAGAALLLGAGPKKVVAWTNVVTLTPEGGHILGNPGAAVQLVEYTSYTCARCTAYNLQSEGVLRLAYIPSGRIGMEVRALVTGPVDLAAAMLVSCGDKALFPLNHNAFLRSQPKWLGQLQSATPSQRQRWNGTDLGTRNRAIASDFKFYEIMESRGYDRLSVDRCLADAALARRIEAQSQAARAAGVTGTPAFSINGKLLDGVTDWAGLRPKLDESLK